MTRKDLHNDRLFSEANHEALQFVTRRHFLKGRPMAVFRLTRRVNFSGFPMEVFYIPRIL